MAAPAVLAVPGREGRPPDRRPGGRLGHPGTGRGSDPPGLRRRRRTRPRRTRLERPGPRGRGPDRAGPHARTRPGRGRGRRMNDNPDLGAARLHPAAQAARDPDRVALVMSGSGEARTYRELDEASTRLARVLRDRGLRPGDHLAVLLDNQPVFFDVVWAAHCGPGCYVTPINWHLTARRGRLHRGRLRRHRPGGLGPTGGHRCTAMGDDLGAVTTRSDGGRTSSTGFEPYEELVVGPGARHPARRTRGRAGCSTRRAPPASPRASCRPARRPTRAPSFLTTLLTGCSASPTRPCT